MGARSAIDPLARAGFGRGSEAYERGRPGYAPAAVAWLAAALRIAPGRRELDLGGDHLGAQRHERRRQLPRPRSGRDARRGK